MNHKFAILLLLLLASTFRITVFGEETGDCAYSFPYGEELLPLFESRDIGGLVLGSVLADLGPLESCGDKKLNNNQGPQPHAFLKRAIDLDDMNILLLQALITYCSEGYSPADKSAICDRELGKLLTTQEPSNGFFWIYYSIAEFGNLHGDTALQALVTAASSPRISINYAEQVVVFSNVINAYFSDYSEKSTVLAVGIAAANLPAFQPLFDMCRSQVLEDPKWESACLDVGYAMESNGNTLITAIVGLGLQRVVYDLKGESDNLAAILERRKQLDGLMERYSEAAAEIQTNKEFLQLWMTDFLEHGEIEAMKLAIKRSTPTLK